MQRCGVYFRKGMIYIETYSCGEFDLWIPAAETIKMELCTPYAIGEKVIEALDASLEYVPHPDLDEMEKLEKKLNKLMGVKSWTELEKTSNYTNLERRGSLIEIYPQRIGRGGGFEPDGTCISCSSTDPEEIGRGVLKVLKVKECV